MWTIKNMMRTEGTSCWKRLNKLWNSIKWSFALLSFHWPFRMFTAVLIIRNCCCYCLQKVQCNLCCGLFSKNFGECKDEIWYFSSYLCWICVFLIFFRLFMSLSLCTEHWRNHWTTAISTMKIKKRIEIVHVYLCCYCTIESRQLQCK